MQAHDYIPSKLTNQNDTQKRNSSIQKSIHFRKKKKKRTKRKKKRSRNFETCEIKIEEKRKIKKEREREKDYAYREEIPDFVRCYGAGVTWCFVARLFWSQSPRKATPPRTTTRDKQRIYKWTATILIS